MCEKNLDVLKDGDVLSKIFKKRKDLLAKRSKEAVKSFKERGTQINLYANSLRKKAKTTNILVR